MFPYLQASMAFLLAVGAGHTLLDVRQLRALRRPAPPPALAGLFSQELYKSSQAYAVDKWWLALAAGLYSLGETLAVLHWRLLPRLWAALPAALPSLGRHGEIAHTVAFVLVLSLFGMATSLPWRIYATFALEQRHGFNKQTPRLFATDLAKSLLLGAALLPPVVSAATAILMRAGPWMPLQLYALVLGLSLFFMIAYPIAIAPLFNKFQPLPPGGLRQQIERLAASLGFGLSALYQVDGSSRSAHSNAYMYGFYKWKRIVLYDTLLEQCSDEQVVAVLAHELGHWKLRHTPISFAAGQAVVGVNFLLLSALRNAPGLYESFGFPPGVAPAFMALLLFQYLVTPLDEVVGFLVNLLSRRFEFQADAFAVALGRGADLRSALLKLEEANKASLQADPWYSAWHHSHPRLVERLGAIDAALAAAEKRVGADAKKAA